MSDKLTRFCVVGIVSLFLGACEAKPSEPKPSEAKSSEAKPSSAVQQKVTQQGLTSQSANDIERRKEEAVALVMGDIHFAPPLVRIHSQCLTGDVFASMRCDCRQQLELALSLISEAGAGILIYEQQEGRGIGLMAKLQAYELQDNGLDTIEANQELGFDADYRQYALPAEMVKQLGVREVRLISNNPEKVAALENAGVKVVERVSAEVEPYEHSEKYLQTKKDKMGHLFTSG